MGSRRRSDGRSDGLDPIESLPIEEIDTFSELLRAMSRTAFGGRNLGEAFEVLLEMIRDEPCRVVLTVSGAMTVAKQGQIICRMLDRGWVDAVVATGALIAHGLTESLGLVHYRHESRHSDEFLCRRGYNRIYDTLEMERNLDDVEDLLHSVLSREEPEGGIWSSAGLCRALGRQLSRADQGPGILSSAFRRGVPVFIPAFTDSEIGLDLANWAMERETRATPEGRELAEPDEIFRAVPPFNPFLDLQEYARFAATAPRLGIFTIGGGVPRNWAQQVGPYFEVAANRLGNRHPPPCFRYGVRICPEPDHWGGLSGCSYTEGVSWGKFVSPEEGGRYAEVHADATLVWPLLMKGLLEELGNAGG